MPKKPDPFDGFTPLEDHDPTGSQVEPADVPEPTPWEVTDRTNKRAGNWPAATINADLEKLNNP